MSELIDMVTSPYWWISAVIVGILVNLAAAYLKPAVDRRLSRVSAWWRQRSERQKEREQALEAKLESSPHELEMAAIEAGYLAISAVYGVLLGVFLIIWVQPLNILFTFFGQLFGAVAAFIGYSRFEQSSSLRRTIRTVSEKSDHIDSNGAA